MEQIFWASFTDVRIKRQATPDGPLQKLSHEFTLTRIPFARIQIAISPFHSTMIIHIFAIGIVATFVLSATAKRLDFDGHSTKNSRKGELLRHRELKSPKGSKGSKSSRPVCLLFGEVEEISGTTDVQEGPATPGSSCDATHGSWDSEECVHYAEPFFINGLTGPTTTFVFDDGALYSFGATPDTEPPLGDGAVCGSVNSDTADKVILTYVGDLTDPTDPTGFDLQNEPAERLESVKYSFWVESCASGGAFPCPNEFYLNVYTRRNETSTNYYDCRFDFVPSQGGNPDSWTTFDLLDIKNTPAIANPFPGGLFIPPDCNGMTTLQEVCANRYGVQLMYSFKQYFGR